MIKYICLISLIVLGSTLDVAASNKKNLVGHWKANPKESLKYKSNLKNLQKNSSMEMTINAYSDYHMKFTKKDITTEGEMLGQKIYHKSSY